MKAFRIWRKEDLLLILIWPLLLNLSASTSVCSNNLLRVYQYLLVFLWYVHINLKIQNLLYLYWLWKICIMGRVQKSSTPVVCSLFKVVILLLYGSALRYPKETYKIIETMLRNISKYCKSMKELLHQCLLSTNLRRMWSSGSYSTSSKPLLSLMRSSQNGITGLSISRKPRVKKRRLLW